jgi:hypothetical protein
MGLQIDGLNFWVSMVTFRASVMRFIMTKCLGSHHDLDDLTTYDLTTITASRLVIDLETLPFCD